MSVAFALTLVLIFLLASIGTPVALAVISGGILFLIIDGQDIALAGQQMLTGLYASFVLLAVPLFILAANIMNSGSISDRLLNFCVACFGRFKGGLGHVNVTASLIFSGMSGSAVADAAGIGRIIINMMTREGRYPAGYAAAITAASATIGPIIPPSIPMVMYAMVAGQSIGYLFLAGIIPGLLMGATLMTANGYLARKRNYQIEQPVPIRELPYATSHALPALIMPGILLYGIYGGLTTPTEAAAIAGAYALLLSVFFYRAYSINNLYQVFVESARSSASIGLIIGAALVVNYIVASENIPSMITSQLVHLDVHPLMFLLIVNLLILLLGALLDATTIILVILPLFIPGCRELGIDLLHFGIVAIINCMIGLITPPYGVLLFVINAVTDISLREIISEIWPFLFILLGALLTLIALPDLVLWLPRLFGYDN
jgi:tripartite ATP-independent transporter DctM subunit